MSRHRSHVELEMGAAFELHVDVDVEGSGAITRDGREIQQTLVVPRSDLLSAGSLLFHRVDSQLYRVTAVKDQALTLERVSDGSNHDAKLQDVKSCMLLVVNSG